MTYIVASIDDNHNGDIDLAKRLIDVAADYGCDAVKFTARSVDLSATASLLDRPLLRYPSLGRTLREVRTRLALSTGQQAILQGHAGNRIDYIIAPYDVPAFQSLDGLDVTALQVDSGCTTHFPLLEAISGRGLPVYAALGACTDREVRDFVEMLPVPQLTLLHTINGAADGATLTHLRGLEWLRSFGYPVGHGDNASGFALAVAATLLGASVIEKRITLDRTMDGPHHVHSLMPAELREMVSQIRGMEASPLQEIRQQILSWDTEVVDERPSVVARESIPRGTVITADMLTLKPPQRGLSPRLMQWLVGKRARYDIATDDFITFGLVE